MRAIRQACPWNISLGHRYPCVYQRVHFQLFMFIHPMIMSRSSIVYPWVWVDVIYCCSTMGTHIVTFSVDRILLYKVSIMARWPFIKACPCRPFTILRRTASSQYFNARMSVLRLLVVRFLPMYATTCARYASGGGGHCRSLTRVIEFTNFWVDGCYGWLYSLLRV